MDNNSEKSFICSYNPKGVGRVEKMRFGTKTAKSGKTAEGVTAWPWDSSRPWRKFWCHGRDQKFLTAVTQGREQTPCILLFLRFWPLFSMFSQLQPIKINTKSCLNYRETYRDGFQGLNSKKTHQVTSNKTVTKTDFKFKGWGAFISIIQAYF